MALRENQGILTEKAFVRTPSLSALSPNLPIVTEVLVLRFPMLCKTLGLI